MVAAVGVGAWLSSDVHAIHCGSVRCILPSVSPNHILHFARLDVSSLFRFVRLNVITFQYPSLRYS